jgi:hypothetical protein
MGLAALILIFMPAGGAQFNPIVTGADWLLGSGASGSAKIMSTR